MELGLEQRFRFADSRRAVGSGRRSPGRERFGRRLGPLLALVGAGGFGGCAELPKSAVQQIEQAHDAYRASRFVDCERLATGVIDRHAHDPDTAEAYYLRGLSRLNRNQRSGARADFDAGLKVSQRPLLSSLLRVQLGIVWADEGRYALAAQHYQEAIQNLPASVEPDEVWYQYGVCLQRSGAFGPARDALRHVLQQYPTSSFAPQARRKLAWTHEYFTVQCGAYAQISSAYAHAENLRQQRFDALAVNTTEDGRPKYVIHVGRYPDFATARSMLPRIRRIQPDAFIMP